MNDLVAQLVEHITFNDGALGSSPSGITKQAWQKSGFSMPYTYIIYSEKLNKYYVGSCINLERRIYEHNIGHSKFTSIGTPWKVVYSEEYPTTQSATKREREIKSMKSRKYIEELIAKGRASRS